MAVLTITTNFGFADIRVAMMKGIIYDIVPDVKIVEISQMVSPQNVREGAYIIGKATPCFPLGLRTCRCCRNPGCGTKRDLIGACRADQLIITPDNGLLTPMILDAELKEIKMEFVHLNKPKYWLPKISNTFHGHDIFAPTGAYLASGIPLRKLGTPITDPVRLDLTQPEKTDNGWLAHVTVIDIFGNLTADLPREALVGCHDVLIKVRNHEIEGIIKSYGYSSGGDLIAVVDSEDYIEVAVVDGDAAKTLDAQVGDIVELISKADLFSK